MEWLDSLYVGCVIFALIYTLVSVIFGDIVGDFLGHIEIPLLQPLTLMSGIASFGGAGMLLTRYTSFSPPGVAGLSLAIAVVIAICSYFFWVKPMERAETSTGYSLQDLIGQQAEVITTIPAEGVGEILITMVNGRSNHIASSLEQVEIKEGNKVVVVDVKEHILYVVPFE